MFNSLKKSLGYLPDVSNVLGYFLYAGNFKISGGQVLVSNSHAARTSLTHNIFRNGEELEIFFHETNDKSVYQLTKRSYVNPHGSRVFEVVDKNHRERSITLILDSNLKSLQVIASNSIGSGFVFTTTDFSSHKSDEKGMILAIDSHFKKWIVDNIFQLDLGIGLTIEDLVNVWEAFIQDEIPFFINKFKCSNESITDAIKYYKLNFLIEASKNL